MFLSLIDLVRHPFTGQQQAPGDRHKGSKNLLNEGCNKELEDGAGRTALDLATLCDNTESIAILNGIGSTYVRPPVKRMVLNKAALAE